MQRRKNEDDLGKTEEEIPSIYPKERGTEKNSHIHGDSHIDKTKDTRKGMYLVAKIAIYNRT